MEVIITGRSLPGIGSKAREPGPNVGGVEGHGGINLPREEALP
jgi:hypothetical protein